MLQTQSQPLLAPGIGDRILVIRNDASQPIYAVVENKDDALSASGSYQESDNQSSWTTISGTSFSIPPGQSDAQTVTSTKRYIALFAQGNVNVDTHIVRVYNGTVNPLN